MEKMYGVTFQQIGSSITHFHANKFEIQLRKKQPNTVQMYTIMILTHTQLKCEINYTQMCSNCV